jgi:hypothetical protein
MESQTTKAMKTLREILTDFEAGRIDAQRARSEMIELGASAAEADEMIDIAQGGDDVIEVSPEQAAAILAEPEPEEDGE